MLHCQTDDVPVEGNDVPDLQEANPQQKRNGKQVKKDLNVEEPHESTSKPKGKKVKKSVVIPNNIVLSYYDVLIREADVELLEEPNWLNDQIIELTFEAFYRRDLLEDPRIQFISPSVSQMMKSGVGVDVGELINSNAELIIIPINDHNVQSQRAGGHHWSLLVVDKPHNSFWIYDSLNDWTSKSSNYPDAQRVANLLEKHFGWTFAEVVGASCRKQKNSYDCGCHVLSNAMEAVARFAPGRYDFDVVRPDNMRYYLKRLIQQLADEGEH